MRFELASAKLEEAVGHAMWHRGTGSKEDTPGSFVVARILAGDASGICAKGKKVSSKITCRETKFASRQVKTPITLVIM